MTIPEEVKSKSSILAAIAPAATVQTTGNVTPGNIPKFASASTITNSIITESSAGEIGIVGELSVTAAQTNGVGVAGFSDGGNGVAGQSGVPGQSTSGSGVFGITIGGGDGVRGESDKVGVRGVNGGLPDNLGPDLVGVSGISTVGGIGVRGESTRGAGVFGQCNDGNGVIGTSQTSRGVVGTSNSDVGVFGQSQQNDGVQGVSNQEFHAGVAGLHSGGGQGIFGQSASGFAGDFNGNVRVSGTLFKGGAAFKIDHPLDPKNKYLSHSVVESPDMLTFYNGNIVADGKGHATITLPAYFQSLNRDFRYQLTVIDQFAQAIVSSEIKDNRFEVKTDKPHVKVSWMVTGVRQDAYADAHRISVEEDKPANERERYLHPELYGQPKEKGVNQTRIHREHSHTF